MGWPSFIARNLTTPDNLRISPRGHSFGHNQSYPRLATAKSHKDPPSRARLLWRATVLRNRRASPITPSCTVSAARTSMHVGIMNQEPRPRGSPVSLIALSLTRPCAPGRDCRFARRLSGMLRHTTSLSVRTDLGGHNGRERAWTTIKCSSGI